MASSHKYSQNEFNSKLNSLLSRNINSKIHLKKNLSTLYSAKILGNFENHKIQSFPVIINKGKSYLIKINEDEKEKNINEIFNKIGLYLSKNNKIIYNFFRQILNTNIYKLKIKVNEKKKVSSICLIYSSEISNQKKVLTNGNNSFSTKGSSDIDLPNKKIKSKKNIIDYNYSKNNYCNYYPKKNEMKVMADKKPLHFPIECFDGINQIHNNIGTKEFLNQETNTFCMNNDSYKRINKKDHFLLNHWCNKNIKQTIINSFTLKYRHKNATFVYYK